MLAAVPLLFAVQQAAEGVVWVTLGSAAHAELRHAAVWAFLAFALVVWPIWMPLALRVAERRRGRRIALDALLGVGVLVSAYAVWRLASYTPGARIEGHRLGYTYAEGARTLVLAVYLPAYVLATVVPFFVSSTRWTSIMGIVLALSLGATALLERNTLVSVWCFFAAVLSVVIAVGLAVDRRANDRGYGRHARLPTATPAGRRTSSPTR